MPIIRADQVYRDAIEELPQTLSRAYSELIANGRLPLSGTETTKSILLRMRAFYIWQYGVNDFLGRKKGASGADFFVETVQFYLKALNDTRHLGVDIVSEKTIRRKRNAIRPDITVWRGNELLASIECKTQLGWIRTVWQADFIKREQLLKAEFPRSEVFLLVMTTKNWKGFQGERVGRQFFALSSKWPTEIAPGEIGSAIETPVESLFRRIVKIVKANN